MTTLAVCVTPTQTGTRQIEETKSRTVAREGKERRADVVEIARQGEVFRVEGTAWTAICFKYQDAPTLSGQGRRCHQSVGARTDYDGVEHDILLDRPPPGVGQ